MFLALTSNQYKSKRIDREKRKVAKRLANSNEMNISIMEALEWTEKAERINSVHCLATAAMLLLAIFSQRTLFLDFRKYKSNRINQQTL